MDLPPPAWPPMIVEDIEFVNLTSLEKIGRLQDDTWPPPLVGPIRGTKNVAMHTIIIIIPPHILFYDYLYVADGLYGVEAWLNPYSDSPTESYIYHHNNNESNDVVPTGNYIYVADGRDGLEIYHRTSTNFLGSCNDYNDDGGIASNLYVQGDYAYVGEGTNGFEIVNISDPYNPIEVSNFSDGGTVEDIIVSGNYAYIADGADGLEIVDISDPYHPKKVGNYSDGGYAEDLDLDGSYVYLADGSDGLEVIHVDFVENSISVNSPISALKWQTGDTYPITWSSIGDISDVKITLFKNGVYVQTIIPSIGDFGSYDWTVSTELAHSTQYQIKIEDASDSSVYGISKNFEIYTNTITITTPESTTSWETSSSHIIIWDDTGFISSVDIALYEDGIFLETIDTDVTNEGSCYWTISSDLSESSLYQIRIAESGDQRIYDFSDFFTITKYQKPLYEEDWFWGMVGLIGGIIPFAGILSYIIKKLKKRRV